MLTRPDHALERTARENGQAVVGLQRCSSEHAKVSKKGAAALLENSTTNKKTSHVPDVNGQINTRGGNAGS